MVASKQTKLKLRKGFHKAPLAYRVLTAKMLSKDDKAIVNKALAALHTPAQVEGLIGKGSKWGYSKMMGPRDVGVILYKGAEVALLYKRSTEEIRPMPCDPIPEGALENMDDVWVRFDLTGQSIRQQTATVKAQIAEQDKETQLLRVELEAAQRDIQAHLHTISTLRGQVAAKKAAEPTPSVKKAAKKKTGKK